MRFFSIVFFIFLNHFVFSQGSSFLKIEKVKEGFFVYKTYKHFQGNKISANGMYLVTKDGVVLIDAPWDTSQVIPLLDSIQKRHHKKVKLCIATHFHDDRAGAFKILDSLKIDTYASSQTNQLLVEYGETKSKFSFKNDTVFKVGEYKFKTKYFGKGHSSDNLIIWFNKDKILYGGCLLKSLEAADLGYLGDADVNDWKLVIEKIIREFKSVDYYITGHQDWKNNESLFHTLNLINEYLRKRN